MHIRCSFYRSFVFVCGNSYFVIARLFILLWFSFHFVLLTSFRFCFGSIVDVSCNFPCYACLHVFSFYASRALSSFSLSEYKWLRVDNGTVYFLSHFLAKNELTYYVGERVGEEREGESCNPKKQRGRKQQWLFSGVTHCIAYENIGSFETPLTCVCLVMVCVSMHAIVPQHYTACVWCVKWL